MVGLEDCIIPLQPHRRVFNRSDSPLYNIYIKPVKNKAISPFKNIKTGVQNMANFDTAFNITLYHEGKYSNDPADAGGETFMGISRVYHPEWNGWDQIDNIKKSHPTDFAVIIENDTTLYYLTKVFYKSSFWDLLKCDSINNQEITNELFDTAVNLGSHRAVIFLQEGLNLLNRNQRDYKDIIEDGKMGSTTLSTLNYYLKTTNAKFLLKIMNILQGYHYISYMRKSPTQERFARGWLERVCL
jgi:lysozyme family protein